MNAEGQERSEPQLWERWLGHAQQERWLVQPCLRNHAETAVLSGAALVTVRVTTILDENGLPEITYATFRMSIGQSVVDNLHRGGLASAVDIDTGRLGRASLLRPTAPWVDRHPDTGERIPDRTLPMWSDVTRLSLTAHRSFLDFILVGWDIAITPEGPLLVEGNSGPDVSATQRLRDDPLGASRFGDLPAFHVDQARKGPWPSRPKGPPPTSAGEGPRYWPVVSL